MVEVEEVQHGDKEYGIEEIENVDVIDGHHEIPDDSN